MIQQAIRAIRILLPASSSVTPQQIEDAVTQILYVPSFSAIDKATLIREVQAIDREFIRTRDFQPLCAVRKLALFL